jgi:ABC-type transport system involved in multi-copper enzyme maturation permease subunit
MVLETPILPYLQWLSESIVPFLIGLASVTAIGILLGFLAAALRNGPIEAVRMTAGTIGTGLRELAQLSPRRLFAIARLAFQESIRRRVLVVFVVFIVGLMFAGWFLDRDSDHPARLYLSFVLTATNYLVLLLAIFISAFSLPNDMKNKTIYTIVTKPVRGWEIVVGRMLGFCAIGTVILALMCLFSYFFVQRGLQHAHELDPGSLVAVAGADGESNGTARGKTSVSRSHVHEVELDADGNLQVVPTRDHTHGITSTPDQNRRKLYVLGDTQGLLLARVPILGELRFLDRSGRPGEGINVGYEWAYRRYVEGGTFAAAIWRFRNLNAADFGDELPLEMSIRVFRTYKGNIEEGIKGTIELVKPAPIGPDGLPVRQPPEAQLRSVELSFTAQEYEAYQPRIPRKIMARDGNGTTREVDVFQDLVDPETGELEIWIRCLDSQQYFGMAQADLYLRAKNRPFWVNFVKGYTSIWFQMVVVTCFGVAFSTFLSGPVAMIATLASLVMGFFKGFVYDVATGEMPGGGPLESLVRIIKQWNQMSELEPGIGTWVIQRIDSVLMLFVQGISYAMPDCGQFNTANFVAHGFDIPADLMAQHFTITLGYALIVAVAGYFFFKTREIAA